MVLPNPKNPYQKKTAVVKKRGRGGGGLSFLTKSKKKQFFMPTLIAKSNLSRNEYVCPDTLRHFNSILSFCCMNDRDVYVPPIHVLAW